ncbi:uncharacterized protein LOC6551663 [Drosophila erecta]|uniref:Uncharacterized protein n=1 Tax=Drosophila erecta TaxID=7220 RepID=B3NW35_DROER|nr:uncharacterized protein LOC6551663 [Drosophila erecta]EDV46168.1 uncharacterized protein Dere_GG18924 [Drosophila erecta]
MEPCDSGPERAMRQYLTQLLETGTTRSTGCLDRFVRKGMSNFPPQSSLEGKASRCSLFEQLLSGGSRKSERLLVPDLATEWFRKQKVFLDKLSPEELAALSDGLADKNSKNSGQKQRSSTPSRQAQASKSAAAGPAASQVKDTEESGGKVAACIPTTEARVGNGNPFLMGNAQTQEMQGKGSKRRRSHWERAGHRCPARGGSCSCLKRRAGASGGCLFQADGQPLASDCLEALRTEPLLPCLRRKFDLRQAPQRRLDPARFRRISPEFFRILASYEASMCESCPLYGISMHHWGDTEACCSCGERHPHLKHGFLGDDSVATAVLPPSRPSLESRQAEELKQPAQKQTEKKDSKSCKEKCEKSKKCCCSNETCANDSCLATKENGTAFLDDSSSSEDEQPEESRRKRVDMRQTKANGQKGRQMDSKQTPPENRQSESWQGRSVDQQDRKQTSPEWRRRFPNIFRRQSQSYRTAYAPTHFSPLSSYPSAPPVPSSASASSPASSPASLPASSTDSSPVSSSTSPEMPRGCQCRHQPRGILSGFTGICKRCIEPGRHLLYNLNANYQQNRERYGQMRQNRKRPKTEERGTNMPFHIATQPAPCSWKKSKGHWNDGIEEGDSSTTLRPESLPANGFHNCHPDSAVIRGQSNSERSLPFRTPTSERTLAGWNQLPQEQPPLEVTQCKCALPQESFQRPPVSSCTFALADAEQAVLQSSEVTRKSISEVDYLRCGHRVKACYVSNDFHQLMKRVAKRRPKSKGQVPSRPKSASPPSAAKAPNRTKDQDAAAPCQQSPEASRASSTERSRLHSKPITTPKSKPRIIAALLPDKLPSKRLNITNSATVKFRSLRKAKKRKQDRGPRQENLRAAPLGTGSSSHSLRMSQVRSDDQEPPGNPAAYSSSPSCAQFNGDTAPKGSSRGTSPKSRREAKPSKRSPSKKPSQRRPSSCSSSSDQRWASQRGVPDTANISDASSWTQKSREPAKKRQQRRRSPSNSSHPSYTDVNSSQCSRAWSRGDSHSQCRGSPLKSAMRKAATQYHASLPSFAPSHLETGRRYYTDTQPGGEVAASQCSCRSLRSATSIRALSSNTDSVRCPCAPAPSVASVEPPQEAVTVVQAQQEEHCCCCRYHTPLLASQPLDAAHPQPSSSPAPCACRRHKAMLFSDAMRWEPQQHHHARTLLRTQRPPPAPAPPPPHLVMYPQYHVGHPPVQPAPEWLPEYPAPCHYPNNASQQWEDQAADPPYYLMPERTRNGSYSGQFAGQERLGRDRAGAIRAAAQGLKGVVKALGGTRPRSRPDPQLGYYHQSGCSQERNATSLGPTLPPRSYQNQTRHSSEASHAQGQGMEAPLYRGPSTSTYYENYPLRNEAASSCDAGRNVERHQSSFRMEGGGRRAAGALTSADEPQNVDTRMPLAIFFESLRAKHGSSEISARTMQQSTKQGAQEAPMPGNDSDSMASSSDDEADADDSLDWGHRQLRSGSEDAMVIPPTYTGLLEEQVLGEYLPSPRCRRRT